MAEPPRRDRSGPVPRQRQPPGFAADEFARFLDERDLVVLDVVRGATSHTRRLLVGEEGTGTVRFAVAVTHPLADTSAVENERRVLSGPEVEASARLRATTPRVVDELQVTIGQTGLILTAVRGLHAQPPTRQESLAEHTLTAVVDWLTTVWRETAEPPGPVELGREWAGALLHRYGGPRNPAPVVAAIQRARRRLAQHEAPRAMTHGCLCPRHVFEQDEEVVGVDDWSLGAAGTDPLRDLGAFAVRASATQLPEVIAGRTRAATRVREFTSAGLEALGLPGGLWREVLVLAQLELAMEAMDGGEPGQMALLGQAVRTLPARL